jgi:hypothetical protein
MKNISKYLAGAAGFTASMAASQVDAAVTAFTFDFGSTLNSSTGFKSNNGSGFGSLLSGGQNNYIEIGGVNSSNGQLYQSGTFRGSATFFATGTTVGNGLNGNLGLGIFVSGYTPGSNITTDQSGYIGFRTSTGNFGYSEASWDATAKVLTIGNSFVESVRGSSITVVPEPSVAGLLAIGAVAAARRRRRTVQAA